ncbi:penicillin acylase family protein [Asaia bogorensis]|uniref:penicillin acylase family protein n=1 Tax=Asaia bogorensis TaxID=91915 RepID=UPI000EFBFDD0|nr:penicillin acylase family protein [Asaia bogorensis]
MPSSPLTGRRALLQASACAALAACLPRHARASAKTASMQGLEGLKAPVMVIEDQWGVPHVRAETLGDAFFANGYLIARDRLWQLDFGYRQSIGRLAEVFGPDFLPSDQANRLFLFQGDRQAEWAQYDPAIREAASAYVAGINAFIRTLTDEETLPPEFALYHYRPLEWSLDDLIRMRAEPTGNTALEIRRARLAARGEALLGLDSLITPREPDSPLVVPQGLDTSAVSHDDLGALGVLQKRLPLGAIHAATLHGDMGHRRANEGSNAWCIAPHRTATGRPILANDPHLSFGVPGPRYVIHLTAPGLDVIGAGTPGMPGIMQGHNADIAFGRTNFHIDQEDLFVLNTHPDHPDRYWHDGAWREMTHRRETIAIRGAAPREIVLRYAAQGPVIAQDLSRRRAIAVSATWLAPGANALLGNIGINLARDWPQFREALRHHTSPTNFTYADRHGNIGWQAAGGLPRRRPHHDGLMPATGDGSFDWLGLRPLEDLPHQFNPAKGWFSTSNEMNLPEPPGFTISHEWSPPYRHERVEQVLDATPRSSLADSIALQHDTLSLLALRMVALLPEHDTRDTLSRPALPLLKNWDGHVTASSAAAALYEVWVTRLGKALHERFIPSGLNDLLAAELSPVTQLGLLENARNFGGTSPEPRREMFMLEQLDRAYAECVSLMGPLPAAWQWGRLHSLTLHHALENDPAIAARFPSPGGPAFGSGGDHYTVMARWYDPGHVKDNPYAVTGGASFLMVCDVGAWDNSLFLNFPGQSGDPASPHYADLFSPWYKGEMQRLPFSPARVDRLGVKRALLTPRG